MCITKTVKHYCTALVLPKRMWLWDSVESAVYSMVFIPSFMLIIWGIEVILRLLPQQLRDCSVGVRDQRDSWSCHLGELKWHDTLTMFYDDWFRHSNSIKIITSTVQSMQCWSYWWKGSTRSMPLRLSQVALYTYQVSWRLVQAFESC